MLSLVIKHHPHRPLANLLRGSADKAQLGTLLDRLIEFTNIHFMSEQVMMREQAYPGLAGP